MPHRADEEEKTQGQQTEPVRIYARVHCFGEDEPQQHSRSCSKFDVGISYAHQEQVVRELSLTNVIQEHICSIRVPLICDGPPCVSRPLTLPPPLFSSSQT